MIFLLLLRFYQALHIWQLSHYDFVRYSKWMKKNVIKLIPYPLLGFCCLLIENPFIVLLFTAGMLGYWCYFFQLPKKRLVFTKRIWRLIGLFLLILLIQFLFDKWITLLMMFTSTLVGLLGVILCPIEKKISLHYRALAKKKLDGYFGKTIAITGSYGKTSVKEYLGELLSTSYLTLRTPESYNTPMGISKVINRQLNSLYDVFVVEFGASKQNDISDLNKLVKPDIAILTAIGPQHLETFKTIDNIIMEKTRIIEENDCQGFVNISDPYIAEYSFSKKVITYGIDKGDYRASNVSENHFDVYYLDEFLGVVETKILGKGNILNLLAAIAVAHYLKIDFSTILRKASTLKNVRHRLELYSTKNITIIDDSFNANISGAEQAIKVLKKYNCSCYVITPGFVELGDYTKSHHQSFAKMIFDNKIIPVLVGAKKTADMAFFFTRHDYPFYVVKSLNEGLRLIKTIQKGEPSAILIENDLPDDY